MQELTALSITLMPLNLQIKSNCCISTAAFEWKPAYQIAADSTWAWTDFFIFGGEDMCSNTFVSFGATC